MLLKICRLNLNKQFNWVTSGQKIDTPNFKLFLKLGENHRALIGVAMSAKYFRQAVKRHQAKRRTLQAVEAVYSNLPRRLNLVIMPKAGVLSQEPKQLIEEIKQALNIENIEK